MALKRDDVQAGRYELLDDQWDELVNDWPFTDRAPKFVRHVRGDVLDLDEDHAFRMMKGGSVAPEGQRQEREARRALAQARNAVAHLPKAVLDKLDDEDLEAIARLSGDPGVMARAKNRGHPQYANAVYGERQVIDAQTSGGTVTPEGDEGDEGDEGHEVDEPGAEQTSPGEGEGDAQTPSGGDVPDSGEPGGAEQSTPGRRGRRP